MYRIVVKDTVFNRTYCEDFVTEEAALRCARLYKKYIVEHGTYRVLFRGACYCSNKW